MKTLFQSAILAVSILQLAACGSSKAPKTKISSIQTQKIKITHIGRDQASQELMLHSMSLIGTPYKYGGNSTATGFDCSGMVQFVYQNALAYNCPVPHAIWLRPPALFPQKTLKREIWFSLTPAAPVNIPTLAFISATANSSTRPQAEEPFVPNK